MMGQKLRPSVGFQSSYSGYTRGMSKFLLAAIVAIALVTGATGQAPNANAGSTVFSPDEISGMYSFTRDGEFVQVSVDDQGKVTGFVSRFGDLESDRGAFLDQFFKSASLDGDALAFSTEKVHGTWFEFKGKLSRGPRKTQGQEGYYVIRGTLTQSVSDAHKRVTSRSRELEMKLFPRDEPLNATKRD
jgi:hypothetical protein